VQACTPTPESCRRKRRTHSLLTELVSGVHWHLMNNVATDKVKFERPMQSVLEGLRREVNWMQRCARTSISKVQWSNSKSEGEQRVLLYPPRRWNPISIFRALKPPSFLNLSPLKPSQNGVDARSDRSMLVHLDLDAHLSQAPSGSEPWRFRTLLEDAKGLCRTRCQCLANRPP
jgi:hypothetical protein